MPIQTYDNTQFDIGDFDSVFTDSSLQGKLGNTTTNAENDLENWHPFPGYSNFDSGIETSPSQILDTQDSRLPLEGSPSSMGRTLTFMEHELDSTLPRHKRRKIDADTDRLIDNTFTEAHYVQELAEMNVCLFEFRETLPWPSSDSTRPLPHSDVKEFRLDEVFRLTERFINLFPRFIDNSARRTSCEHATTTSLDIVDCTNLPRRCYKSDTVPNLAHHGQTSPDFASLLLLVSSHLRLIDIYERIFVHARTCVQTKSPHPSLKAPPIQVGNFLPSLKSTATTHVMLVISNAAQLLSCAYDLVGRLQESTSTFQEDRGDSATVTLPLVERKRPDQHLDIHRDESAVSLNGACNVLRTRSDTMSEQIETLRLDLMRATLT